MQALRLKTIAALAAGLTLSACATALSTATGPQTGAAAARAAAASKPAPVALRDLTAAEKKTIIAVVAPNLKNPDAAKYHWLKFPAVASDAPSNYCATVDAQSPYPPYSGRQAYIVEVGLTGNSITSASMGLIAGGKDAALVAKMCAKYGLDPFKAE